VAHMGCATIATPLIKIYQWRILKCATNVRCATSHKKYAPLRFENSKNSKKNKNKKNIFFENHKN
jgi:hypothetical protein